MKSILKNKSSNFFLIARGGLFLFGATIGVGIFALPEAVYRFGVGWGLVVLLLVGVVNWLLNLLYAQLVLGAGINCQLAGYGRHYLGKIGYFLGSLVLLVNINGALLAYLIGAGNFLNFLLPLGNYLYWGLIFFALVSVVVFYGLRVINKINSKLIWLLIVLLIIFLFWGLGNLDVANLRAVNIQDRGNILGLVSILFFSYASFAVVPELGEINKFQKKPLLESITLGGILTVVLYFFFVLVVIGLLGSSTGANLIDNLAVVSPFWARILAVVAVLALVSSFFSFSFALREFWYQDVGLGSNQALLVTLLPSLALYLLGVRNFTSVVSITGGVSSILMLVIIFSCWGKMKFNQRKPDSREKEKNRVGEPGLEPGASSSRC